MKQIFTLLSLSLFVFCSFTIKAKDNVRIKKINFQTNVLHFPKVKIPKVRTYDLAVHVPDINFGVIPSEYQVKGFNLPGWEVDIQNPTLIIDMYFDNPKITIANTKIRKEPKSREVKKKDTTIIVIDTLLHFSSEISLYSRGRVMVQDSFGKMVYQSLLPIFNSGIKTPEFNSEKELRHFIRHNQDLKVQQLMGDFYNHQICQSNNILYDILGYYVYQERSYLALVRSRKDPMRNQFNYNAYRLKEVLQEYFPSRNDAYILKKLKPYEEYFKKVLNENKGNSKRAQKLRYISAANLTEMNLIINRFGEAIWYAGIWRNIGKNRNEAYRYIAISNSRANLKNLNNWNYL